MLSFKSIFRSVVAIALVLTISFGLAPSPAHAFGGVSSKATDGEASLSEVRAKSEDVAKSNPRSGKEVSNVAQGGLNGVQGSADSKKMIQPSDTDASTVKDDIESGIKNIMGQ